jgi:hypothetical protein
MSSFVLTYFLRLLCAYSKKRADLGLQRPARVEAGSALPGELEGLQGPLDAALDGEELELLEDLLPRHIHIYVYCVT